MGKVTENLKRLPAILSVKYGCMCSDISIKEYHGIGDYDVMVLFGAPNLELQVCYLAEDDPGAIFLLQDKHSSVPDTLDGIESKSAFEWERIVL